MAGSVARAVGPDRSGGLDRGAGGRRHHVPGPRRPSGGAGARLHAGGGAAGARSVRSSGGGGGIGFVGGRDRRSHGGGRWHRGGFGVVG
ncbi:MAG: hypothetical protein FGM58_08760 [Acidimicrobiia bacterium]|nr:hypothetical protein [Acidimicrobiia bacterium]